MIISFRDKELEHCWREARCGRIPAPLRHRVLMKLDSMEAATNLQDLRNPPGNRLHRLSGPESQDCWAMAINGPWRLVFRFEEGHIHDVRLVQYH